MVTKERIIFSSDACDYDFEQARKDCAECLEVKVGEVSDEDVWNHIYDDIEFWYEFKHDTLDKELEGNIIAFGSVGRWNGDFSGYKVLGNNLNEILSSFGCDDIKVYMDRHGVHSVTHHHDGSNYMQFRLLRNDRNSERFLEKIYSNSVTKNDIYYYTKSLKPVVKEVFGW